MFCLFKKNHPIFLIVLCALVYSTSYLGKFGFSSNVNGLIAEYGATKQDIGLVGTCLFLAYGLGQFIHGFFSKKYSSRWMVSLGLLISGFCNLLIIFVPFVFAKFIWAINGFALSILFPVIMKTLGDGIPKRLTKYSLIGTSLSLLLGFVLCYGLSALFSYLQMLKWYFITSSIIMSIAAIAWVLFLPNYKAELESDVETTQQEKNKLSIDMIVLFIIMSFVCLGASLSKEGLTTWSPSMLLEIFNSPDYLAILITILLQVFASANGIIISLIAVKKPNFLLLSLVCAIFALINSLALSFFYNANLFLTVFLFIFCCFFFSMLTHLGSIVMPLILKNSIPSGVSAGVMNGMCYVGSAIAVYLVGFVAENSGWKSVYLTISFITIGILVLASAGLLFHKFGTNNKAKNKQV